MVLDYCNWQAGYTLADKRPGQHAAFLAWFFVGIQKMALTENSRLSGKMVAGCCFHPNAAPIFWMDQHC